MRWNDAVSWANQLEYGGLTNRRLPTTESGYITAPDCTTNSEMEHLYLFLTLLISCVDNYFGPPEFRQG